MFDRPGLGEMDFPKETSSPPRPRELEEKMMFAYLHVYAKGPLAHFRDQVGASLGEYALLLAFIAILAIGGITLFGIQLGELWQTIATAWTPPGS